MDKVKKPAVKKPSVKKPAVKKPSVKKPAVKLVLYTAKWCGPCKALKPVLLPLVDKLVAEGKVEFRVVSCDESWEEAARDGVRAIPTIRAVVGRKVVVAMTGFAGRADVVEFLRRVVEEEAAKAKV